MEKETARVEAFSDGVFAIAITLLILEIKIPPASSDLGTQLLRQWPSYVAFVISFAFIGIMWINHHRLFTHIHRSNTILLILNLLLLLGVCWVPYPTAILAQHLSAGDQKIAALLYHGSYFVIAIFFNVLWQYATHAGLLSQNASAAAAKISRQYAFGPSLYLICVGLVWVNVSLSLVVNFALAIFFAVPAEYVIRKEKEFIG